MVGPKSALKRAVLIFLGTMILAASLLLLLYLVSCRKVDSPTPEGCQDKALPNSAIVKLKQGLDTLVEIYNCKGEEAAIAFASDNGITVENDQVNILIYTIGDSSEAFVDDLKSLDIDQCLASSLTNVVQATVPIGQLLKLAEQDFVLYITPPPKTYVVP